MSTDFAGVFAALRPVLSKYARHLRVTADTPTEYTLLTKSPSPFPQHKGKPLFFGSIRLGKAYVSMHLLPLYLCPKLTAQIPPALKRRMQGKACFNFKGDPDPEQIAELKRLVKTALKLWRENKWLSGTRQTAVRS